MLCLGGHIVFIVLGQHLVGHEALACIHAALSHHTLAFFEQIRQQTCVAHGHFLVGVGHDKLDHHVLALHAADLDQTAYPKVTVLWRLPRSHLRGCEEKHQIALEGIEHKIHGPAEQQQPYANAEPALMTRFHATPPSCGS